MTYIKRILGLTVVMALTAFAAPAFADNNPISAEGYSSPSSLVGTDEQSRHPMSGGDYSSPSSIGGGGEPVTEPMSSGDYSSPSSLVGPTPEQPVASSDPTDSGFDWTDGLLGLVAGIALAAAALAASRVVKHRRLATSSF
jgi:hypothetical protein